MLSQEELAAMVATEEERLGVGSKEFMERHNEIMEEIDCIQKREQARKEGRENMEALKKALTQINIHGDFDTRTYEHIIIVYCDREYLGTYNSKAKSFIDLDISRIGKGA